jgi:transcriptional regulator with XRE-family HTH domain
MADKLGMSRAGYGNIELGRGSTSVRRLEEIAAILGTTAADLLRESQTSAPLTESLSA